MNTIINLKIRREKLMNELTSLPVLKPQFACTDVDDYQSQLELGWYKEELRDEIESIDETIECFKRGPIVQKQDDGTVCIITPDTKLKREIIKVFRILDMSFSLSLKERAIVCDSNCFDSYKEYTS